MTVEKIDAQKKKVLKRVFDAISFLDEIKKRREMQLKQEG